MLTTVDKDRASQPTSDQVTSLTRPDETLWQKYSPNGESILSGVASFTIHAIALILLLAGVLALFGTPTDEVTPKITMIPKFVGGNGEGTINGDARLAGTPAENVDVTKPLDVTKPEKEGPPPEVVVKPKSKSDVPPPDFDQPLIPIKPIPTTKRPGSPTSDKGENGIGPNGTNHDQGVGDGPNRRGNRDPRQDRVRRWELVFSTNDARHYLQQLDALGAVVAVPDQQARLMTIRNLRERPARPTYEDTKEMNRIFWVDDRRDSCESVARELGLEFTPSAIVAFFPQKLENQLVRLEMSYKHLTEDQIERTRFSITFQGGEPVIRVIDQEAKKGVKKI